MTAIPDFLSHLPAHRGLPVPFTQAVIDGVPDFRATDFEKILQCAEYKLCAICGRRLGEYAYFIGGPLSKENHLFTDPPMHKQCTEYAAKTCPFVFGRTDGYSKRPIDETALRIEGAVSAKRPEKMFILKSRTKDVQPVKMGQGLAVKAGRWLGEQIIK